MLETFLVQDVTATPPTTPSSSRWGRTRWWSSSSTATACARRRAFPRAGSGDRSDVPALRRWEIWRSGFTRTSADAESRPARSARPWWTTPAVPGADGPGARWGGDRAGPAAQHQRRTAGPPAPTDVRAPLEVLGSKPKPAAPRPTPPPPPSPRSTRTPRRRLPSRRRPRPTPPPPPRFRWIQRRSEPGRSRPMPASPAWSGSGSIARISLPCPDTTPSRSTVPPAASRFARAGPLDGHADAVPRRALLLRLSRAGPPAATSGDGARRGSPRRHREQGRSRRAGVRVPARAGDGGHAPARARRLGTGVPGVPVPLLSAGPRGRRRAAAGGAHPHAPKGSDLPPPRLGVAPAPLGRTACAPRLRCSGRVLARRGGEFRGVVEPPGQPPLRVEVPARGTLQDVEVRSLVGGVAARRRLPAGPARRWPRSESGASTATPKVFQCRWADPGTLLFIRAQFENTFAAFAAVGSATERRRTSGPVPRTPWRTSWSPRGPWTTTWLIRSSSPRRCLPPGGWASPAPPHPVHRRPDDSPSPRDRAGLVEQFLPVSVTLGEGGEVSVAPRA